MRETDSPPSVGFHPAARRVITFGPFRFDFADGTLSRDGTDIPLPPRALGILHYLLERPGRIVSKQALMDAVWKDAHVSETSLTEAIGLVRNALGDDSQQPRFVQTVHRRGYRFIAPISIEGPPASTLAAVPAVQPSERSPDAGDPLHARSNASARAWRVGILIALAVALASGTLAWLALRSTPTSRATRVVVTLPPDQAPAPGLNAHTVLALSPDGRRIVYVAGQTGSYRLFHRPMDRFDAVPIAGTDGGHGPFFAPGGASVGFFQRGQLMRIAVEGGEAIPLADAPNGYGGAWGDDGTIVYAPETHGALWRVPAHGGNPVELTQVADGEGHRWPDVLPGGRAVLFTVWKSGPRDARIAGWRPDQAELTTIVDGAVHARYLRSGHLAFVRNGVLMIAPFDVRTLRLTGAPVAAVGDLMTGLTGAGQFSIADSGALLYLPEDPNRRDRIAARVDPSGAAAPLPLPPRPYQNIAPAPDGRRVAVTILDADGADIWIGDVDRGSLTRLTSEGTNLDPVWTPDGRQITYGSSRAGGIDIYQQAADGGSPAQRLWSHPLNEAPGSWSPDGRTLAFFRVSSGTGADIFLATDGGDPRPVAATRAHEMAPRISPDGRWLAYQSNESGRMEIYVRPMAGAGRLQLSTEGGTAPAWLPAGRALSFRSGSDLIVAEVESGSEGAPVAGAARRVLSDPAVMVARPAADGSFIVLRRLREHHPLTTMHLVLDWTSEWSGQQ